MENERRFIFLRIRISFISNRPWLESLNYWRQPHDCISHLSIWWPTQLDKFNLTSFCFRENRIWYSETLTFIWDKLFKNSPCKICERQSLKNLKWYGLGRPSPFKVIEAVFHKFYLVHSWILWVICWKTLPI